MSCCPPDSAPYLKADYSFKGHDAHTPEGVEFYTSGTSTTQALIIIPDVWGYHGGRTRNVADFYAEDFTVLVPKVCAPAHSGGVDGDGLPPDFDLGSRMPEFMSWVSTVKFEGNIEPKLKSIIDYIHAKGIKKIGMIGFCWGGWVMAKATIAFPAITVGATAHPALHLEEYAYGGSIPTFSAKIHTPMLFLPAGNDPDIYREGGIIVEATKGNNPKSQTIDEFKDMVHGWVLRGDVSDKNVDTKVKLALD